MLLTSPVMYSPHMREMRSLRALVLKAKLHCFLCTQILFCYCVPRRPRLRVKTVDFDMYGIELENRIGKPPSGYERLSFAQIFLLDTLHFLINAPKGSDLCRREIFLVL